MRPDNDRQRGRQDGDNRLRANLTLLQGKAAAKSPSQPAAYQQLTPLEEQVVRMRQGRTLAPTEALVDKAGQHAATRRELMIVQRNLLRAAKQRLEACMQAQESEQTSRRAYVDASPTD